LLSTTGGVVGVGVEGESVVELCERRLAEPPKQQPLRIPWLRKLSSAR
jgi:hypothetical protein